MKKSYLKFNSWISIRMAALFFAALLIAGQSAVASANLAPVELSSTFRPAKENAKSGFSNRQHSYEAFNMRNTRVIERIIRGKVVDENGEALPGVGVQLKGTTTGTVTNANGEYSLTIPGDNGTLVFTFIGFTAIERVIGSSNTMNTTLTSSQAALDEFVVVGYGTQRKIDVTGAIASVQAKDLIMTTSPDVGNLLKGKLSGLVVVQNSAQPGGGQSIQIRGATSINASNEPLVVVDGFPISNLDPPASGGRYESGTQSILNSFNPNDIESITVLKDASATSIYGARAANGVLLITTKPGVEGKPKITYSANAAVGIYKDQFDTFNLKEWMAESNRTAQESWDEDNDVFPWGTVTRAQAEANPVNGLPPQFRYTQAQIDAAGEGTNWVDLITRSKERLQQHNLSLSGGTRGSRYYFSGNVFDNDGVVRNTSLKRYSFRMNLNQDLGKYVKLGINLTASRQNIQNAQLGDGQHENSSLIKSAIEFNPSIEAIDASGKYPLNPEQGLRPNPYSMLAITDQNRKEKALINTTLEIRPIKEVIVTLKAGLDRGTDLRSIYQPSTTFFGNLENGIANSRQNDNNVVLYEATANFNKVIKKHSFTLLGGVSQQKFKNGSMNLGNTGFITDAFLYNNIGAGSGTRSVSTGLSENMLASYYGRLNYGFADRYLLTVTARTDGASVFSENHKWATFPSASVAWVVTNEPWFQSIKPVVSNLKLRVGYGNTGNSSIGNNAFAAYGVVNAWLTGDDKIAPGVLLSRLENPDLKWETSTELNLGLDFSLFNDKIEASVEVYRKRTDDLLNQKPLNSFNFINTVTANIGSTQSKGYELSLTSFNVSKKDFQWRTRFAFSHNYDSWLERAEGWIPAVYENEKDPIDAVYSQRADGILQLGEAIPAAQPLLRPGQIKIKDLNGFKRDAAGNPMVDENQRFIRTGAPDGRIDEADNELIGVRPRRAKYSVGLQNIISYKNLSLNFDFNGLLGRRLADPNFVAFGLTPSSTINTLKSVQNRWTPTNPSTTHPSAFSSNYGRGDFFMRDGSFVRLGDILFGYTLGKKQLGNLASSLQINVGANNLFVLTGYKGIDPETDSYAAAYPNVRRYTLGVNATF